MIKGYIEDTKDKNKTNFEGQRVASGISQFQKVRFTTLGIRKLKYI